MKTMKKILATAGCILAIDLGNYNIVACL